MCSLKLAANAWEIVPKRRSDLLSRWAIKESISFAASAARPIAPRRNATVLLGHTHVARPKSA